MKSALRVGTRGSKLALTQTGMVVDALRSAHPGLPIEIVQIRTTGDKKQGTARDANSDKRDWIKELEEALLAGEIDLAVHSGKDIPAEIAPETRIASVLERATPYDVFIPHPERNSRLADLAPGAIIGTASLRRRAQLLHYRSDLSVKEHRGNVPTRLEKLVESEELAGIVLAAAGLERLQLMGEYCLTIERLEPPAFLPAINQGILAVQFLAAAENVVERLSQIQAAATQSMFAAERGVISQLAADCNSALGVFATVHGAELSVFARVLAHDGSRIIEGSRCGASSEAMQLGLALGEQLVASGAQELLLECAKGQFKRTTS